MMEKYDFVSATVIFTDLTVGHQFDEDHIAVSQPQNIYHSSKTRHIPQTQSVSMRL